MPRPPRVELTPSGALTFVAAEVDPGGARLEVERAHIWWSNDRGLVFGSLELEHQGGGVYTKLAAFPTTDTTIAFVDVVYSNGALIAPQRFSLSSPPQLPASMVPSIRRLDTCLP